MNSVLGHDVDRLLVETRIPREKGWRPTRRQRRRAVALGVLVLVSLAGWLKISAAPPELKFTNIAAFPLDPSNAGLVHNVDNRLGREVEIDPVRAGRFSVLLDLVNEGSRPVKLRGLPDEYDWSDARYASPVLSFDRRRPEYVEEPFRPLTLGPGESITVRYTFRFSDAVPRDGCMMGPDRTNNLPVSYRKLGLRRTRSIPFDGALLSPFPSPRCDGNLKPAPAS